MSGGAPRRSRARPVLVAVAILVVLGAVASVVGPPSPSEAFDPRGTGPDGLRGVVDLLEASGVDVEVSRDLPSDISTRLFVPTDRRSEQRDTAIRDWVEDGGTAIVAGPSRIHRLEPVAGPIEDMFGPTAREPGCDAPALASIGRIEHAGWDAFRVPDDARVACFATGDETAWLVGLGHGAGTVVAVGSPVAFVNAFLDRADNAALAATLLGPSEGTSVVVLLPPAVGEGEADVLDLVPDGFWRGLALLTLALLVAIVWQARRLGPPVDERLPPVLPAAELARSISGLLHRSGDRESAARRLRADARQRACRSLGLPASTRLDELIAAVGARAGVPRAVAERALVDGPIDGDDALLAVARACHALRHALAVPERSAGAMAVAAETPSPPMRTSTRRQTAPSIHRHIARDTDRRRARPGVAPDENGEDT